MEEQYKDIKHLVKEAGLDHPNPGFLNNVMNQIEVAQTQKSIVYKPLISKKIWFVIGLVIVGLLFVLPFLSEGKASIIDKVDLSFLNFKGINNPLSGFTFHKTTIYGMLFLAILFFVQIPLLKRRIDRSFSI